MLAKMKEMATAGPACSAATVPVSTNIPAPIVQLTPKQVRLNSPKVRCREAPEEPVSSEAARRDSTDLRANNAENTPPAGACLCPAISPS